MTTTHEAQLAKAINEAVIGMLGDSVLVQKGRVDRDTALNLAHAIEAYGFNRSYAIVGAGVVNVEELTEGWYSVMPAGVRNPLGVMVWRIGDTIATDDNLHRLKLVIRRSRKAGK